MGAPGLAFETWDPSNLSRRAVDQFPLETPLSPLSLGAKPTCPGVPWRDPQFAHQRPISDENPHRPWERPLLGIQRKTILQLHRLIRSIRIHHPIHLRHCVLTL